MATPRKPVRPPAKAPADHPRAVQPHGGSLLVGGVKGNRGHMGTRTFLEEQLGSVKHREAFKLASEDPAQAIAAHKFMFEALHGKPKQPIDGTLDGTLTIRVVRE